MSATSEFTCLIDYYASRRAYRYLLHACSTVLTTASGHSEARFYRAFALISQQSSSESIRELESLIKENNGNGDYTLAATAALISAYKGGRGRVDKEGLEKVKEQLKALSKTSDPTALLHAGRYFLHAHKDKQAKQCLEKLLLKQPHHVQANVYLATLHSRTANPRLLKKALNTCDGIIQALSDRRTEHRVDINASLLAYLLHTDRHDHPTALALLNAIIVEYPTFTPALIEKSGALFNDGNWEESLVLNYRILQKENHNVFALFSLVLYFLVKEGANSISGKERMNDLLVALDKCEGQNELLYQHFSTIIARLAYRNKPILTLSIQMLTLMGKQRAAASLPPSPSLLIEQAYQHYLSDDLITSSSLYQQASKLEDVTSDDTSPNPTPPSDGGHIRALIGLIHIKLRQGRYKEASEELEFLNDLTGSTVLNAGEDRKGGGGLSQLDMLGLRAVLAYHYERDVGKASALIQECAAVHREMWGKGAGSHWDDLYNHSYDAFITLHPHLIIDLVHLALFLLPAEPAHYGDPPSPLLTSCISMLSTLLGAIPGHLHGHLLHAKLLFLSASFPSAQTTLQAALTLDPTCAPLHLLSSYLTLYTEQYKASSSALEQARSCDFEVRNTPHYHFVKAKLLIASGQLEDAKKVLIAAVDLPGVKTGTGGPVQGKRLSGKGLELMGGVVSGAFPLTDDDRLSIFLELASVYSSLGLLTEASRTMADAKAAFSAGSSSSSASTRLLMSEVDLHCSRHEFDAALSLLRSVPVDSSHGTRAKVRMAELYLTAKKNRKAYIGCYQDLCSLYPTLHHFLLLADAYMGIQDPDSAIISYEKALDLVSLADREAEDRGEAPAGENDDGIGANEIYTRIGKAMIATHDYHRAVQYYEEAIRGEEDRDRQRLERAMSHEGGHSASSSYRSHVCTLLHDLAALFLKMKKYDDSAVTLQKAVEASRAQRSSAQQMAAQVGSTPTTDSYGLNDLPLLQLDVKSYALLSKVHRAMEAHEALLTSLNTAYSLQTQLLSLLSSTSPLLPSEKEVSSSLAHELAVYYQTHQSNYEQAVLYYHEALKANPTSIPSLLSLSQLHFSLNDFDAAQTTLLTLLRVSPHHKTASLLLAEIMYEKNEHDQAIYHFTSLLDKDGTRFDALSKMIDLLKRAGRLSEAPRFIDVCEKAIAGAKAGQMGKGKGGGEGKGANDKKEEAVIHYVQHPGLHYCKGLYHYYHNSPRDALIHLNYARKDFEWGRSALALMIDVYINPDHLDLFIEATEVKEGKKDDAMTSANLQAAERLLAELAGMGEKGPRYTVLECYTLLAGKVKAKVEKAVQLLNALIAQDGNYVPALLCLANVYAVLGQPAKTRNYLKRVSKMKVNGDYVVEFEKSYLMLAEIYLEIGKFELSTELCKKVLGLNKSNGKAWEILGGIMEKEAAYRDASDNYEQAWYNCGQSNVNIGYKLAFNYLKCRKFVECIDICHAILKINPDMPKVRKDVLDKARNGLRP